MKNLTTLLLTLLVLGGCSQEPTELERCIAKNLEIKENRYFEVNQSECSLYESHKKKLAEIEAEAQKQTRLFPPGESAEEREQRIDTYIEKYFEELREFKNSCQSELRESESNRRAIEGQAETFCNSQGIY